ncbi:hypothetical protein PV328_004492 [Microctonus aethiopoides]|uniref:Uncharacterized protein n=1 Tax=Microctonus aethiopoides TaxID=144406 RepID=A0AA39FAN9_9HYME|nr:hypothetical protein PV328_004492 [Microctonus aethiopoides]
MNINNINDVITNLYEALVLVRYPGIALIDLSNFQNTVLAENNRKQLLHWLLVQSINVVDSTLKIPTADETLLVEWYSQFGVCINKNALLCQCPLTEQLDTLVNLTEFIMNVLGADDNNSPDVSDLDQDILQNYIQNKIDISPSSHNLSIRNLSYRETQQYIKSKNQDLKDEENNIHNGSNVDGVENSSVSKNTAVIKDLKVNLPSNSAVFEEFCEVFRSIDTRNKSECENSKENLKSVDNCIESIDAKFTTFNKTLRCKNELSNAVIPTDLNIESSPLNQVIQEIVIGFENLSQLNNAHDAENRN